MGRIVFSEIGLIHLIASIAALIARSIVLIAAKGTKFHKTIGCVYAASMVIVVVTAFTIYRLFGGFGIFHVAAIVSGATLAGGMIPVILRRPRKKLLDFHFSFMFGRSSVYMSLLSAKLLREFPVWDFCLGSESRSEQ
jgi:uncharacterized membrane protein